MSKRLAGTLLLLLCLACAPAPADAGAGKTLKPYANDAELVKLFAKWKEKGLALRRKNEAMPMAAATAPLAQPPPPPSAPAPATKSKTLDSVSVTGSLIQHADVQTASPVTTATSDDITNVQTQGVDEGDIVKKHGDYLIVLRRGRLFTIRIGGDALQPVSAVNAYAPDADPSGTWYDEMLISDDRIVVIGYSYARGGTEIGLFDLDDHGHVAYSATYQMRSNDYYSSRNYASRLIGHQLIFYSPLYLDPYAADPFASFPALRRWHDGATPADFHRILPATRVYQSGSALDPDAGIALHSVSTCDLDRPQMQCRSTAVLGPTGRAFYVSEDAVYVWTSSWNDKSVGSSAVFRIPLDGRAPSGLRTSGSPIDQMSFLQEGGYLDVLLGRDGNGEGMWAANGGSGQLALMRVKLSDFGDGTTIAPRRDYRVLSNARNDASNVQNRFIGDWLVYGTQSSDVAHALRYAADEPVQAVRLGHPVERIEALGDDAILVGSQGRDLHFTSLALRREARAISRYVQPNAAQGDQRTHGFFYRPEAEDKGIVGLPVVGGDDGSAAVLYLRNLALRLARMGRLESHAGKGIDDACKASCVDWYGNARPIFVGDRVFALLGYELVEGRIQHERITERRRADFAPGRKVAVAW